MRKDKEKKTAITARLQYRLWHGHLGRVFTGWKPVPRSGCCCSQECRCDLRARGGGFTLAEILIVVLIIAIAAMIAVPMIGSMDSMQIRSAANMIAADLEYAKSMAISRGQNYSVVFDPANDCYEVRGPNGIIEHPVKKGFNYKVDFSRDSRLDKVVIDDADFDSSKTITFDSLGSPHGSGTPPSYLIEKGEIRLKTKAGDFTITVRVEPVTGFISIE